MERCERCGDDVDPGEQTVVLSNDVGGEIREHVYCSTACAIARGQTATAALGAIAARRGYADGPGGGPLAHRATP
jgi:hypothetical protein